MPRRARADKPRSHAAALLAALAAVSAAQRPAGAGDGGALDVEVGNRAAVNGAISAPQELDTLRIRVPANAEMTIVARGSGRVRPVLRLFGTDDVELDVASLLKGKGRTVKLQGYSPGPAALYRIDVRSAGQSTGNYRLDASWRLPARAAFSGATAAGGANYTFDAEGGTRIDVDLRAVDPAASVRATRISGPRGYDLLVGQPPSPSARHRLRTTLPYTGRYQLDLVTDVAGRSVTGTLGRKPPTTKEHVSLRNAERRGAGVARMVSRVIGEEGGDVEVPRLEASQRVSLDASGVCLSVPVSSVSAPASFQLRTDNDAIDDPLGFAPAGVSVHFDAAGSEFAVPVRIALPYDAGAFAAGEEAAEICVLELSDDGGVFEVPRSSYTVDPTAGTVSFPTSTFSSFQAFSPPVELAVIASPGAPNDLAVAPDESALYISTDVLTSELPASAVMRYVPGGTPERFAGGGTDIGDGVDRLDYDFDGDMGFSGVLLSALAVDAFGNVLVVTGDLNRSRSVAYIITTTGLVVRIAGDGTPDLDESQPARRTGLPFCCAAAFRSDGNAVVATESFIYPVSDRVLSIVATGADLDSIFVTTVAGGGDVDVSGAAPLATRILKPRAVLVDSSDRILVGDVDWLIRFDLVQGTTTTLAGTNFGETAEARTVGGLGAPLRTVVLGTLDDLAFARGREDILYAADPEAGIVWRFDLVRDRAFVAAGRRPNFDRRLQTRDPDPDAAEPGDQLSFPVAVAPLGDEVFIAERFDARVFSLRRVNR